MDKSEFLSLLQEHLDGNVPSGEIYSNIQYYSNYIDQEVASGKTPEEVLDTLGDPRLIAKTIIDADEAAIYGGTNYQETYTEQTYEDEASTPYEDSGTKDTASKSFRLDLRTWYGKLIVFAAAGLIIFLLITLVSALLPVIIVFALIGIIINIFKNN